MFHTDIVYLHSLPLICYLALRSFTYERVGHWYEIYSRKRQRISTLSTSGGEDSDSESDSSDVELDDDNEEFLRSLDPKSWKVWRYLTSLQLKY